MSEIAIEAHQLIKKFPARPGTGDKPTEAAAPQPKKRGLWPFHRGAFEAAMREVHERHRELMARVCGGCDWVPICSRQRFTLRDPDFRLEPETGPPPRSSEGVEAPGP